MFSAFEYEKSKVFVPCSVVKVVFAMRRAEVPGALIE
jgi:hypothetical protein